VVLNVSRIDENSPVLEDVIRLSDQNRKFLGFFPQKAFIKSAATDLILCAVDEGGQFCGYLLYYVARGRVVIQQLCVDPQIRRKGVGKALVDHLKAITSHLDGILLHCCRDFPSHQFWPQMGFVALDEKPGRGEKQRVLTRYWFDHGHATLFSSSLEHGKTIAVMDANVLFDIQDGRDVESTALLADWLSENVELKITTEVFNEVDRQQDAVERKRRKSFARYFEQVECRPVEVQGIINELANLLPVVKKPSDRSDQRQLAMAIRGGAEFFLTRDSGLLTCAERLFECLGITVIHPAEFILCIDELIRRVDYQPVRLAGTRITVRRIRGRDVSVLGQTFLSYGMGEKLAAFERRLHSALCRPTVGTGYLVEDTCGERLGLVALCQENDQIFTIPFFRVKRGTLAPTLARGLAMLLLKEVVGQREGLSLMILTDPYVDNWAGLALCELGFSKSDRAWVKISCGGINAPKTLAQEIRSFEMKCSVHRSICADVARVLETCAGEDVSSDFLVKTEQRIWPGKLRTSGLPNFIVPIQPRWAIHLFDEDLARQNLFGAASTPALSCENVYYRAKDPQVLQAPGRILWYVSEDKGYQGSKSIRACSILHEVATGKAKDLFSRFQRLGIYNWDDVRRTAKGDPNGQIMAFRFAMTHTFAKPILWEEVQRILLAQVGTEPPLSTPLRVPQACFEAIYKTGSKANGVA